jgi:autotransporter-associated beta strand protein
MLFRSTLFRGLVALFAFAGTSRANIPGGGTGTGANVTLTDSGTTVTMSNGIVSILITKSSAQITSINYTFNNTGSSQTLNLLSGNSNGGKLYWEHSNNQGMNFTGGYTLVADPNANGGDYAEISLYTTTQANMPFEVHYSMRRGSPGFYVTPIFIHDASLGAFGMGECRDNIYAGGIFNWMSVDATRNKLMQVGGGTTSGVPNAPVECSLWTSGLYQGRYEDKYKYSAAFGDQRVWGWSSVTANGMTGKNVGLWNVLASAEFYNGGPLKPELMCHMGTTILNMINGGHYGMGGDNDFVLGESWSKVCGPYFIYCNNIPSSTTNPVQASQALYNDAVAQAAAEATAWPYSWFNNPYYAGPSARGTVTGKMVINDSFNPNASAANLWVGLIQQPVTSNNTYDFQQWMKPYQFWVHTDANGNFTLPAVPAGTNYTLYAFGQGAPATFMSQQQTGGTTPFLVDVPASPFAVTVTAGATTALGNVTWTPARTGPTVFEIGYPDRTARKFRHGDDYWVGDIGPTPSTPNPVWSKWLEFPYDFPNGLNYTVGSSRWSTDWNFIQPVLLGSTGGWNSSASTITFNLAAKPASGTQATLYLGIASDYYTALTITVNGTNLGSTSGVTATPSTLPSTGFVPTSSRSDSSIREYSSGGFSDQRITLPGTLLKAGANTITIGQRQVGGTYFANHAMYDYLRLELTGYVPPAPASVTAFSGNNRNLVTWPVVPGATSYNLLRSTVSGSGYVSIATAITGPVSGSGLTHATYADTGAVNGTPYYYVVQSVNPVGTSANSPQSTGTAPSVSAATAAPSAPNGLSATAGNASVTLNWNASTGAHYYTVRRSTLVENGAGSYNTLSTIPLTNSVTGTTYTDTSPTNGTIHSYSVSAANAVGESTVSSSTVVTPVALVPVAAPPNLTVTPGAQQITLTWSALTDAVGYIVQRATTPGGPYTYQTTISSLTYLDDSLPDNTTYYYVVSAMNSGGVSGNSVEAAATTAPVPPSGLAVTPGNTQATLTWSASPGATGYQVQRATVSGGPYTTINSNVAGPIFTDTGLTNGTVYYYVVVAQNGVAASAASAEISVTPVTTVPVAPTGLSTSTVNLQIMLNWSASSGATSYTIRRSTSNGGPYTTLVSGITATTYTDAAVSPGNIYYYVVAPVNAGGTGANSVQVSGTAVPPSLAWSGAINSTWDSSTLNWLNSGASANYVNGAFVTFNDNSSVTSVTLSGTLTPATVTVNASQAYTFSGTGAIDGAAALAKSGSGTLTISSAHTFTGGTTLNAGTLTLGNAAALGTGAITLSGGTLGTGALTPTNAIVVTADSRITGGSAGGTQGIKAVSGSGILTLEATTGVFDIEGSLVDFTGTVSLDGTGSFRLFGSAGSAAADFDLGTRNLNARSGTAFALGSLTGAAGSVLSGSSGGGNNVAVAYTVGANNHHSTFSGVIANGNAATSLTKTGSGTLTLTGTNTYTGATTVSNGSLLVTGSLAATPVSVANGAAFGGTGTLANNLTLASGATLFFGVTPSATKGVTVSGTSTLNGTTFVSPVLLGANLTPGTYTVLTYTGSLGGSPAFSWSDSTGSGLLATFSTATANQVRVTLITPLQSWRQSHFGSTSPAADTLDPDNDGLPNLLEYALGQDPHTPAAQPPLTLSTSSSPLNLSVSFTRVADPYLTYTVQGSSDLVIWTDLWTSTAISGPVTVTDSLPATPRRFLRLKVTTTSP